jgi:ATP-binding cassette subfamily B protein
MNLRERFAALRNLPPFLRDIWRTSPMLALSSLLLRLARALLPIATLYVGKLIVDEAVRLVGLGAGTQGFAQMWDAGVLDHLLALLAAEFALAVAADILGRIVGLVDSLLSELYSNATSVRLMEHAASLDLEDFEDAELQDKLDRARRQVSG